MQLQTIDLLPAAPGVQHRLRVMRFGAPGSGPRAMIQAALHADEVPAMLVAHRLRDRLLQLEAEHALIGQVLLVPYANPLGLAQQLLGQHQGRFDVRDGGNFNRGYADLAPAVAAAVGPQLGSNAEANAALIRDALCAAARKLGALHPAQDLKNRLLQLATDCEVVLDLHCDSEAAMHVYALTPQADIAQELGALLGARAVLLATESGDSPFDEACSRPWLQLQQQFPAAAVPLGCFCATVELRGQADTAHTLATQDADALVEFLRRRGIVAGTPATLPAALCQPTPLAGSEPITAPKAGVVIFHRGPGDMLAAGDLVADLVDVDSGDITPVRTLSAGVLYARMATRWAGPGERLAKVAGTSLARTGKLLSP
jgi:predicted deacylase